MRKPCSKRNVLDLKSWTSGEPIVWRRAHGIVELSLFLFHWGLWSVDSTLIWSLTNLSPTNRAMYGLRTTNNVEGENNAHCHCNPRNDCPLWQWALFSPSTLFVVRSPNMARFFRRRGSCPISLSAPFRVESISKYGKLRRVQSHQLRTFFVVRSLRVYSTGYA